MYAVLCSISDRILIFVLWRKGCNPDGLAQKQLNEKGTPISGMKHGHLHSTVTAFQQVYICIGV